MKSESGRGSGSGSEFGNGEGLPVAATPVTSSLCADAAVWMSTSSLDMEPLKSESGCEWVAMAAVAVDVAEVKLAAVAVAVAAVAEAVDDAEEDADGERAASALALVPWASDSAAKCGNDVVDVAADVVSSCAKAWAGEASAEEVMLLLRE